MFIHSMDLALSDKRSKLIIPCLEREILTEKDGLLFKFLNFIE